VYTYGAYLHLFPFWRGIVHDRLTELAGCMVSGHLGDATFEYWKGMNWLWTPDESDLNGCATPRAG
jgi:hypothetical protein